MSEYAEQTGITLRLRADHMLYGMAKAGQISMISSIAATTGGYIAAHINPSLLSSAFTVGASGVGLSSIAVISLASMAYSGSPVNAESALSIPERRSLKTLGAAASVAISLAFGATMSDTFKDVVTRLKHDPQTVCQAACTQSHKSLDTLRKRPAP